MILRKLGSGLLVAVLLQITGVEVGTAQPRATYHETYRPQYHYTPPRNWMNDPNGLVYHEGTYHLFHQYNPEGNTWGNMSWYHATSTDLVHWTHEGVAIPEEGNEMIFSGSAVVDHANTSGFGRGDDPSPMVAVYTSHYSLGEDSTNQAQSLAYSTDGGKTWTKYDDNPVLDHADPSFRDPSVFWYEPDERWIMAVALSDQRKVEFYTSDDLKDWTHLSTFGPAGAAGGIWECPALFQVPVAGEADSSRWILEVDVGSHAVAGGSGGQYFVGRFDGTTFTPHQPGATDAPHWVDHGPDFYAAIPWTNAPDGQNRPLWLGWMNNWDYAQSIPTSPWRSAQTVVRSLSLKVVNGRSRLVQQPARELKMLREEHVHLDEEELENETVKLDGAGISGKALELVAEFAPGDAQTVGLNVRVGTNEKTVVGYDAASGTVFVDRSSSGAVAFHDGFAGRDAAPISLPNDRIKLHVLVDWSSVEVFANDGTRVLTHRIFPSSASDGVSIFASGGAARLTQLDAWSLRSTWHER